MEMSQKLGGIAALIGAATNLLGMAVFVTLLAPKGLDFTNSDPSRSAALLAGNQAAIALWYGIIYLAFGVSVIFLSLALYERLKAGSPVLAQAVSIFTLIWAVLVIVVGTLSINDLSAVVRLFGQNPAHAATLWSTLGTVETGLGAGGGETMVSALWLLLLGCAARRVGDLRRVLNYFGMAIGVIGILSVVLASADLMSVYGVGLIIWLIWLGIILVRRSPVSAAQRAALVRPTGMGTA